MDNRDNNSGVNTILIVLLIIIIVGALVWFFRGGIGGGGAEDANLDVNVSLPEGTGGVGGDQGGGDQQ
jgi:uncharacterized membrane protein